MRPSRAAPELWGPEAYASRFDPPDERKPRGRGASENDNHGGLHGKPTPTRKQSQLALMRALYGERLRR